LSKILKIGQGHHSVYSVIPALLELGENERRSNAVTSLKS
jgi:hypothetical protein